MDPNANIERQRELAAQIIAVIDSHSWQYHTLARPAGELAELVQALDQWRRGGGFDPYPIPDAATSEQASQG